MPGDLRRQPAAARAAAPPTTLGPRACVPTTHKDGQCRSRPYSVVWSVRETLCVCGPVAEVRGLQRGVLRADYACGSVRQPACSGLSGMLSDLEMTIHVNFSSP